MFLNYLICGFVNYGIFNINLISNGSDEYLKDLFFLSESKELFGRSFYYLYWSEQYGFIFIFMVVSLIITLALMIVAFVLSPKELNFEKVSVYECGFEPFGEANDTFNIQFFVVGILFMIFDLELAYLFPWVMHLGVLSVFSFSVMFFFFNSFSYRFYLWVKKRSTWLIVR